MDNKQPPRAPSKRVTRVTAAILTVAFLGFVFAALAGTLANNGHDVLNSLRMTPTVRATLPEHPDRLDRLAARINSFTSKISEVMWMKDELGYVNSDFQYALGKRMINTGSQNMIRLNTGHLYDLVPYKSLVEGSEGIADLVQTTLKDIPALFVYEHPTLYDASMMPAEYAALDHSAEMADEVVSTLRARGVRVLDSRDVLPKSGYPLDDLLWVTDQHWSTLSAITMARAIAGELNGMTGAELEPDRIDPDTMEQYVHEKFFLGKYGQRVGTRRVTPDDIIEYWPRYDTNITRETKRSSTVTEHASGPFRETCIRRTYLEPDPGKTWSKLAYTYYGQVEYYSVFENPDAPDFTILLLKDSYSAPIGTFLSLLARHVIFVDMRQDVDPLPVWLEKYQPDAVVIAYSLQMMRDDNYEFAN
ncbi:MAG: hypothetical protein IJJ45_00105 [Clostridia bacterium]|nr:hypothetical protein [Clostridia bacterium]